MPREARKQDPTVGEYFFFFAWANRLIDPHTTWTLPDGYRGSAVDEILPVDVEELTSQRYRKEWNCVSAEQVEQIGKGFFERV